MHRKRHLQQLADLECEYNETQKDKTGLLPEHPFYTGEGWSHKEILREIHIARDRLNEGDCSDPEAIRMLTQINSLLRPHNC